MSDEEQNSDSTAEAPSGFQRVSVARHWRQRFQGLEGDYIYRKPLNIRGTDGKMRRVRPGEPVDIENDGLVVRRLKALWYAEAIELADPTQQYKPRKVTIRDNRAIRLAEAAEVAQDKAERENYRNRRNKQRALEKAERAEREAAETAVLIAEKREADEYAKLEEEERKRVWSEALQIQLDLEDEARVEEEEREAERKAAADEEKARLDEERAQLQVVRDEEQRLLQIERNLEKAQRAEERAAALALNRRSDEERAQLQAATDQKRVNPNNKSVDAKEARKALGKRPSDKE